MPDAVITTIPAVGGGGSSEWVDTGTILHPTETDESVVIGGTTAGNSDIILDSTGAAVFNEGGYGVDFRVESNTDANCLVVDGSRNEVGIGVNPPTQKLDVNGTVKATTFSGSGASLTALPSSQLTGALPAISGAALTGVIPAACAFKAHDATGGYANLSAGTVLPMQTEQFDIGGNYDNSTYKFTAPFAGIYMFCWNSWSNTNSDGDYQCSLMVDDSVVFTNGNEGNGECFTTIVNLAASAVVHLQADDNGIKYYRAFEWNEFSGCYIGPSS